MSRKLKKTDEKLKSKFAKFQDKRSPSSRRLDFCKARKTLHARKNHGKVGKTLIPILYYRTRSRSPVDRSREVSPVEINLETHCVYCCKQVDNPKEMGDHVKKRHADSSFVCRLCDGIFEPDLPSAKNHLKRDHDKDESELGLDQIMDYFRFPKNLSCIKCNLCGLMCHAQKVEDLELHFNVVHPGSKFSSSHLDFLCRICMSSGQNDTMEELKDHLYDKHPDELK